MEDELENLAREVSQEMGDGLDDLGPPGDEEEEIDEAAEELLDRAWNCHAGCASRGSSRSLTAYQEAQEPDDDDE